MARILVMVGAVWLTAGSLVSAHGGQAFSAPISDEVLEVQLRLPNGKTAQVRSREGTMITVEDEKSGYKYGFIPILEPTRQSSSFMVLEFLDGGERIQQIPGLKKFTLSVPLDIKIKGRAPSGPGLSFRLNVRSIETGYFPNLPPAPTEGFVAAPDSLRENYGKAAGGDCCVRCYSVTVCATSVSLDCGSCTSGGGGAYTQ